MVSQIDQQIKNFHTNSYIGCIYDKAISFGESVLGIPQELSAKF